MIGSNAIRNTFLNARFPGTTFGHGYAQPFPIGEKL
jgi:hypothetical protein